MTSDFRVGTLISLMKVEAGVNVEGEQILQIGKCGGWNKRGGQACLGRIINMEGENLSNEC